MKKRYYYDYKQTLPTNTTDSIEVQPADSIPADEPTSQTPEPTTPSFSDQKPTSSPSSYQSAPIKRSNFLPIVIITLIILIIGALIISRLPKDYDSCLKFPGSKTENNTCQTFYGKTYTQGGNSFDIELPAVDGETPTTDNFNTSQTTDTTYPSTTGSNETTKGNQPITTQAPQPTQIPQPTPTYKPSNPDTSQTDVSKWTTHRYPEQNISLKLPSTWSSTRVTRDVTSQIMTFKITSNGTVVDARIQPNWDNTGDAKNQAVTFMLPSDVGVIKQVSEQANTYYFEYMGRAYIFICYHYGNADMQNMCDSVIKSIQFI